ncbi:MAG: endoribonuclease MazF [Candidatus Ozemobacteraceae bacterium]
MAKYIPDRGDIVWINMNPQVGREQSGRRPAIVLSPLKYNSKAGLSLICPITSQTKGYPFEVIIPEGFKIKGTILADQFKSIDWDARQVELIFKAPERVIEEVQAKIIALIRG